MDDFDPITKLEMALKELDAQIHLHVVRRMANEIVSRMRAEIVRQVETEILADIGDTRLLNLQDDLGALSEFWRGRHKIITQDRDKPYKTLLPGGVYHEKTV